MGVKIHENEKHIDTMGGIEVIDLTGETLFSRSSRCFRSASVTDGRFANSTVVKAAERQHCTCEWGMKSMFVKKTRTG